MNFITKKIGVLFLALTLAVVSIPMQGCSSQQFVTDLNLISPAVLNVLEIIALFRGTTVDTSLTAKISADVAAINKLYGDYQSAVGASQVTIKVEIQAAFTVLNSDLSSVFALVQVSDPATEAKVAALIGLIQTSVILAEDFITPSATADQVHYKLTDSQVVDSYNRILTARLGNKNIDEYTKSHELHIHNSLIRHLSFGIAK